MREIVFNMVNPCPNQVQTSIFPQALYYTVVLSSVTSRWLCNYCDYWLILYIFGNFP